MKYILGFGLVLGQQAVLKFSEILLRYPDFDGVSF